MSDPLRDFTVETDVFSHSIPVFPYQLKILRATGGLTAILDAMSTVPIVTGASERLRVDGWTECWFRNCDVQIIWRIVTVHDNGGSVAGRPAMLLSAPGTFRSFCERHRALMPNIELYAKVWAVIDEARTFAEAPPDPN